MNGPHYRRGQMASHIGRRKFLATLGGAAAVWPLAARAQQGGKRYTIGILSAGGAGVQAALDSAFFDGLRELGWVEGKNVVCESRNAENRLERLPELAADLVRPRLELLKEVLPRFSRVAVLWNAANPYSALVFKETQAGGRTLGIEVHQ